MSGTLVDDGAIPPGEYRLAYCDYRTAVAFGQDRVVVRFKVADFGEQFGHQLERWYRVKRLRSKPKKYGRFDVGRRSDLYREYVALFGEPGRGDRISFAGLKGKQVVAKVRTVTHDKDQNELPAELRYSVIDELLGIES